MRSSCYLVRSVVLCFVCLVLSALAAGQSNGPQTNSVRPLITQPVNNAQLTPLTGNVHPLARAEFDQGAAPADLPMQRMLLVLKRSPEQQQALTNLLDQQQDKNTPSYHQWLTPEQFGALFGPADSDIQAVTGWLQGEGFQVSQVSKGRMVIEFSGTAAQVQQAFHTTIHKYLVNGEAHWANATDPQIPSALAPAVAGVASLHNFFKKPMNRFAGTYSRSKDTGKITAINPLFTFPEQYCSSVNDCFAVGPYDFATIYNLTPLWSAGTNGTGQTIAIVGRTNINPQDPHNFRSLFGLSTNDPTIILNGPDPGINGDEGEADIDVQWSGAAAPGATIDLVVSESTETTDGVDLSALYVVDNNLAGIMSESYGQCEYYLGAALNQFYASLWAQAAAQGITAFVSSGDSGSAGCDVFQGGLPEAAQNGLQVNGLASTPFNVAVGGTDFNDFSNPLTYWNTSNSSTTEASAKGYIPESTWNDSCTNAVLAQAGFSTNPEANCNDGQLGDLVWTVAGSGGKSSCINGASALTSCTNGYAKPSWQTGTNVPNDASRDLPDVSLFASNGFIGSFYIICQADTNSAGTCDLNAPYADFAGYGGTSVASPAFAGIMALVDQKTGTRQGNANYILYKLAAKASASCASKGSPASSCTFYDVTAGTIAPPCWSGSLDCTTSILGDTFGVLSGYNAAAGYDLATGLGSVNAANLVNNWSSVTFTPSATTLTLNSGNPVNITHGAPVNVSIAVTPQSGSGTPTGNVALLTATGQSIDGFTLSNGTVTGSTSLLPGGTYTVSAHYGGDGTYGGSDSTPPVSVTVGKENSKTALTLATFSGNAVTYTDTAVYGSLYLLRAEVTNSAGVACDPGPEGELACPTGTVTLTDNSKPLDAGAYTLNSLGYFEDQTIELITNLTGGSHALQAQYAGDASFNPSTGTATITINRGFTYAYLAPSIYFLQPGNSFQINASIDTTSFGAAPTGAVNFLLDGVAMTGTATTTGTAGNLSSGTFAGLSATLNTTVPASTTPGQHSLTITYAGDANYASTSGASSIDVTLATTAALSANPASPAAGGGTTLTAVIDSTGKGPAMTGNVNFVGSPEAITGTPTFTATTDASGNTAMKATVNYTPTVNHETVYAQFSGDSNYASSVSSNISIAVAGSDFTFTAPSGLTIGVPGGSNSMTLTIDGQASYTGTATFGCAGLPAESTCSFSPTSVVGSGTSTLMIQTTGSHTVSSVQRGSGHGYAWVPGFTASAFLGLLLIGGSKKGRARILLGLMAIALFLPILSCGGGGGSSGGGSGHTDPGTPAGNYTITVTATSGSTSHSVTFMLSVG